MDRLELVVHQRTTDERRQRVLFMNEALPVIERLDESLPRRWRNEVGHLNRRTRFADPVLCLTELTGRPIATTNASHEACVEFLDESLTNRQLRKTVESQLQRADVVGNFTKVTSAIFRTLCA